MFEIKLNNLYKANKPNFITNEFFQILMAKT